ncbi:histidine--tRNA ligase [Seonamhaeicola sp. S2-3]|uniref:histidine--tRNA ligase n=1 Tax=Seonamhaeicola sp. S2-3 TaxID=1936081 RepID=UPI00097270F1|nr:histidine--tRNA ligase [Seonamhaeicola sp. S2-3]APY12100.1 histidine--tRNA ligase [Seonamhaeicola sp. S2-3]
MAQKPSIPKGTRDFNPEQVAKRNYIFNTIRSAFETFGFQPIETPSFENSSTLMGKYGDEGDRLIFKILNSGDYVKNIRNEIDEYSLFINSVSDVMKTLCVEIDKVFGGEIERSSSEDKLKLVNRFKNYATIRNIYKSNISRFGEILTDRLDNNSALRILLAFKGFEEEIISHVLSAILNKKKSDELQSDEVAYIYSVDKVFLAELYKVIFKVTFSSKLLSEKISEKALRYDLTVPFARYVVQHQNEIEFPFKRYQIQPVWRADRPQKGRFREFYQCDADVVGSKSLWQEVEFIQLYDTVFSKLKLQGVTIKINNRKILSGIAEVIGASNKLIDFTVALDKLDKIGEEKVKEEMLSKGISQEGINKLQPLFTLSGSFESQIDSLKAILSTSEEGLKGIEELTFINNAISELGLTTASLQLDVTLARGLNYYTGAIFEVSAPKEVKMGSIGGGGRYDDLTGIFGMKNVSGVGISFGLDRIYLVLEELNLFPETVNKNVEVLFINFGEKEALFCLKAIKTLRKQGVNAELYPDAAKMKKQMTHANRRHIPFVVLVGDEEINSNTYTLKNMVSGEQSKLSLEDLIAAIK